MIKMALVCQQLTAPLAALSQQQDIAVQHILPESMEQIIEQIGDKQLDILAIIDSPEGESGLHLARFLSLRYPSMRTLLAVEKQPDMAVLEESGFMIRGYIIPEQMTMIEKAVRVIHSGEVWLPREMVDSMLERYRDDESR